MRTFFLLLMLYMITPGFATPPDCRRNEIDCIGLCGRFIDKNKDGFCDLGRLSKPANPAQTLETEPQKLLHDTTLLPQSSVKQENSLRIEEDTTLLKLTADTIKNQNLKPVKTSPQAHSVSNVEGAQPSAHTIVPSTPVVEKMDAHHTALHPANTLEAGLQADEQETNALKLPAEMETSGPSGSDKPYNLILISALTLGLYLITHLLKRFELISKTLHRRIWNLVLLITFLVSGVLGLVLVVQINYEVLGGWYLRFLNLHVEFGISMALVSMIHALWHIKYYALALGFRQGAGETKIRQLNPIGVSKRIPFRFLRPRVSAKKKCG